MQTFQRTRHLAALVALAALTNCASDEQPVQRYDSQIGMLSANLPHPYIVQFAAGYDVDATAKDLAGTFGLTISHRYDKVLRGAAVRLPAPVLAKLQNDPRIAQIDYDFDIYAIGKPGPTPPPAQVEPVGYLYIGATSTANEGAGQRVAVLDTGIDLDHPDLVGSIDADFLKDCVGENTEAGNDLDGHGSHVAGTIAASNNAVGSVGIGNQIKVVPVKVLNRNGKGSWSSIICGIDYVTSHVADIRVANMSLGGTGTYCAPLSLPLCVPSALQVAVQNSVTAGVTYAVAAGNEGALASSSVPAAYPWVIAVSAYDTKTKTFPTWSNYGPRVDLAAPGVGIFSTYKNGGYATLSGTSMASPHVAAAAALYLSTHSNAAPDQVRQGLQALGLGSYSGQNANHQEKMLQVHSL